MTKKKLKKVVKVIKQNQFNNKNSKVGESVFGEKLCRHSQNTKAISDARKKPCCSFGGICMEEKECNNLDEALRVYEKLRKEKTKRGKVCIIANAILKGRVPCRCGCARWRK